MGCCRKMTVGVLRSSLFLSLYCTLAWRGACAGFNLAGRTTGAVIASSCWVAGLAVLVEKRSRRMELALYCLSRVRLLQLAVPLLWPALARIEVECRLLAYVLGAMSVCWRTVQAVESFALTVAAWGWVRPSSLPRRLDVLMFCLASGAILHCYSDHGGERRSVFRTGYLNVFDVSVSISHQREKAVVCLIGTLACVFITLAAVYMCTCSLFLGTPASKAASATTPTMQRLFAAACSAAQPASPTWPACCGAAMANGPAAQRS